MSSFIHLRPWSSSRDTTVTPSSVLRRVPPHQPAPPRPFWHRLLPQRHSTTTNNIRQDVPTPEVIFESTIIGEPQASDDIAPPKVRPLKPHRPGLFRLSASLPSMSRRNQSRRALTDAMMMAAEEEEEETKEEETKEEQKEEEPSEQQQQQDISSVTTSSSLIRVFAASRDRSPVSLPPTPTTAPTAPTRRLPPFSSEEPDQSFTLPKNLEPAILEMGPSYVGRITNRNERTITIRELVLPNRLLPVPAYIGKLNGWYTEIECREIFRGMCQLVYMLHKNRSVHRNLHVNQFLVNPNTGEVSIRGMFDASYLESYDPQNNILFTDKPIVPDRKHRRRYDWFAFRSPELDTYEVSPRHGKPTDVWSMGVCLYVLLMGIPPFRGSGRTLRHCKMTAQTAPYEITTPSDAAQDLIARMIVVNPTCRLTMAEVLAHPWMQNSFATDVDLSLTQTLFMDWDNRHRRRHSARRSRGANGGGSSSLIVVGGAH